MTALLEPAPPILTVPTQSLRPPPVVSGPVKALLIAIVLAFMTLFFFLPLYVVFHEAFRKGWAGYAESFDDPATIHSIWLTLKVAAIAVPLNTIFGLAAAWTISRFQFKGKRWLSALIELPLWISPVIAGLIFVLLFGAQGIFGPWIMDHDYKVIFALPGIVLSTLLITFPFVARVVTPLMESQGQSEEEAAMTLGANGWQVFYHVTLPKIKWGLIYGIILCNARSMGEFGAVSVVSGHIREETNTLPLQIEVLYNEYHFVPAFAAATILALLAVVTLLIKTIAVRTPSTI